MTFQKLYNETHSSDYIWLLFLPNVNANLEEVFANINIPFDCEFLVAQLEDDQVILTEVYHVDSTLPLHTHHFGNWTKNYGLSSHFTGFYIRRKSLHNAVLKTGTMNGEYMKISKEINNKPVEVGGIFGSIWHVLQDKLNFTSDYYKPKLNTYGAYFGNGSWNGLVGLVVRKEVQITNGDFIWNAERMRFVDFITPVKNYRMSMFIKRPDSSDQLWDSYFTPLNSDLWMALLITMIILSVSLWLTHSLMQSFASKMADDKYTLTFAESFFYTIAAFCSTGNSETPVILPSRMVYFTTYMTAVIMMVSYSASLISHIMTYVYGLPFTDFQEFLDDGRYQLSMRAYGAQYMYFKLSNNSMLREVYSKHIAPYESSMPMSVWEGLQNICKYPRYASMGYETMVSSNYKKLHCELQKIPNAYISVAIAMAIQKKSPYLGIFKHMLRNMQRSGILSVLHHRYFPDDNDNTDNKFTSVALSQVVPLLVVWTSGILASIVILLCERVSFCKLHIRKPVM